MRSKCVPIAIATLVLSNAPSLLAQSAGVQQQPSSSAAAPKASSGPDSLAKARTRFNDGVPFFKKQNWPKAYEAFLDAWKLMQHPQIALNLGLVEVELGKHCDAIEHLQYALTAPDIQSSEAATVRDKLAKAKANIGTLTITVEGAGAEVLIDDTAIGTAPVAPGVCVEAGSHTVMARTGNARDQVTDTYEAGTTREVKLAPKRPPPPPATTTTAASTVPSTPLKEEPSGPRNEILIGGGVAAGAMFVAGAVFAGLSASKLDAVQTTRDSLSQGQCNLNGNDPRCNLLLSLINERNGLATAAMWSFIGGTVFGGVTLAYWFLAPKPSTTAAPTIRARIALNPAGGLILDGVW